MSQENPIVDDYLRMFEQYGEGIEQIYLEAPDDRYELLFERAMRLLVKPSQFNLSLPEPFRRTAHRYLAGNPETLRHLEDRDTRHFMLAEIHDYVLLNGGLARRRELAGEQTAQSE